MAKRITIMLDEDLLKKLRMKHAKMIMKSDNSISLSRVINHYLKTGLAK